MKENHKYPKVAKKERLTSFLIPLKIPNFNKTCGDVSFVFAPDDVDSCDWYFSWRDSVLSSIGKSYLPVMRMSDGEYRFLFGEQPPSKREKWFQYLKSYYRYLRNKFFVTKFSAGVAGRYSSGTYEKAELKAGFRIYEKFIERAQHTGGYLALHATVHASNPFNERYYFALKNWLKQNNYNLDLRNYIPFYFVYALTCGPDATALMSGHRILLVTHADRTTAEIYQEYLSAKGARSVSLLPISSDRSMFDQIDVSSYIGKCDLVFVGAGIGKPNILRQLEPLSVPCIDIGYVFNVWKHPDNRWLRPFCVTDEEFELVKLAFMHD